MTRGDKQKIQNMIQFLQKTVDDTTDSVDRLELLIWIECLEWVLDRFRYEKKPRKKRH